MSSKIEAKKKLQIYNDQSRLSFKKYYKSHCTVFVSDKNARIRDFQIKFYFSFRIFFFICLSLAAECKKELKKRTIKTRGSFYALEK